MSSIKLGMLTSAAKVYVALVCPKSIPNPKVYAALAIIAQHHPKLDEPHQAGQAHFGGKSVCGPYLP
jgi:hypothetical protein